MREAGRITALALQAMREAVRPGISTKELDAIAEDVIRRHNATPAFLGYPPGSPFPFPASITASINDELVHGIPREDRVLQEGDIVSLDCGAVYKGYVGDSAFSMGMLCDFKGQLELYGAHRYKELFWECGAIGQQLYLEATSLKLSVTGIGCFLDDVLHRMLGLENNRFQTLYHFTVGRAIVDMRLTTLPPYEHRT